VIGVTDGTFREDVLERLAIECVAQQQHPVILSRFDGVVRIWHRR
jgi:hypothetical protein